MKKAAAIILALMLGIMAGSAQAISYTVDEKFWGQAEQVAVKGTVSFSVTGDETAALSAEEFQLLKQTLPGTILSFAHGMFYGVGGHVVVETADGAEKKLEYLKEEGTLAFGGDLVAHDGTWYTLEEEALSFLSLFGEGESDVPGILDIMQWLEAADEEWQAKAGEKLAQYETRLSMWMNNYAGTAMGQEDGLLYSELNCRIPAEAVKAQILEMLHVFYADGETLSLLGEVLDGTGGEIYLNPAMESVLCDLVSALPMAGEIEVIRRFDSKGQLVLDSIRMPLPPLGNLRALGEWMPGKMESPLFPLEKWTEGSLTVTGRGDLSLSLENDRAEQMLFSANRKENNTYTGQLVMDTLNEDGGMDHVGYAFEYTWQAMDETYSLQTDICERLMQGAITLTPDGQTKGPAQRITLDMTYTTTSEVRSPAYLEAVLVWRDMETEAAIALACNVQTANPFEVGTLAELENVLPLEQLPLEERRQVMETVLFAPLNQAVTMPEL